MKRNILNKLFIALAATALFSCKAKKQLVTRKADSAATTTTTKAANPVVAKIEAVKARQTTFNTFSGRAKTKLNIDGKSNDVTLNIRIQHDKKIWVSITAILGLEVARALITPDSIQVINKLQSVYVKKPFSYIHNYAGRQVNYQTVEALLIGNAINELLNENGQLQPGAGGNSTINGSLQGLVYSLLIGPDQKVTQTSLTNQAAKQSLKVTNSQFVEADNRIIPSHISIASAVSNKNIQAELEYNRTEFNRPLDYPFSIPQGFSPAN
ncbi:DUF4292 domain-containing protein [Mucilaginibacter aquatilis]|uniref:DUF4292 domain-containing protein n=1 Tax=Mucilaginibacter aquatilis TaxID=1517760 RepID=A0A6I4IFR5_9SPHI|nr:DUF4292 domain-containing protein [Mucilaginibacter aquatilis]MVN92386.1 DUF4292 domain-containing protein [Mucilaginibacter aquatilis]